MCEPNTHRASKSVVAVGVRPACWAFCRCVARAQRLPGGLGGRVGPDTVAAATGQPSHSRGVRPVRSHAGTSNGAAPPSPEERTRSRSPSTAEGAPRDRGRDHDSVGGQWDRFRRSGGAGGPGRCVTPAQLHVAGSARHLGAWVLGVTVYHRAAPGAPDPADQRWSSRKCVISTAAEHQHKKPVIRRAENAGRNMGVPTYKLARSCHWTFYGFAAVWLRFRQLFPIKVTFPNSQR
jgi:hypothetical protein